jgi:dihydromonapterin reductase/dihydrofolate reductase
LAGSIVITGVGKRLGFFLAESLLKQGYHVIGSYRTDHSQLEKLRLLGAELLYCDFYQQPSVENFISTVKQQQSIRAIIHNASDWLAESSPLAGFEIMQRMMSVHVAVPYQINLALREHLVADSDGGLADIIHISDYVAEKGSKKHIAYAASKAALENMTLSFAALLAPTVKVNSIAPSLIIFNDGDDDAYKLKSMQKSLLGREAGEQEFINTVQFLLNSQYITGRTIALDGGRHLK